MSLPSQHKVNILLEIVKKVSKNNFQMCKQEHRLLLLLLCYVTDIYSSMSIKGFFELTSK